MPIEEPHSPERPCSDIQRHQVRRVFCPWKFCAAVKCVEPRLELGFRDWTGFHDFGGAFIATCSGSLAAKEEKSQLSMTREDLLKMVALEVVSESSSWSMKVKAAFQRQGRSSGDFKLQRAQSKVLGSQEGEHVCKDLHQIVQRAEQAGAQHPDVDSPQPRSPQGMVDAHMCRLTPRPQLVSPVGRSAWNDCFRDVTSRSRPQPHSHSRSSERSNHRRTRSQSWDRERRKGRDKEKREKEKDKGKDKELHNIKRGESGNIKAGLEHLLPAEQAKARLHLVLEAAAKADEALKAKERNEAKRSKEEDQTTLVEQVKRVKEIEAIESDSFVQQTFRSSKEIKKSVEASEVKHAAATPGPASVVADLPSNEKEIDPSSIPTAIKYQDDSSLAHPNLFIEKADAEEKWFKRLTAL
ncbi:serine/Arginine-related protein 53-like [Moschus berezovskii]|uniref:serine/Arginine-related protein 53-like n=1 Tax=Moschus berezovskii TaxID=68408 RepID=UPI002443D8CA|nr:serine/Arginine-related protein 53-like [Moschus berezovskii]